MRSLLYSAAIAFALTSFAPLAAAQSAGDGRADVHKKHKRHHKHHHHHHHHKHKEHPSKQERVVIPGKLAPRNYKKVARVVDHNCKAVGGCH